MSRFPETWRERMPSAWDYYRGALPDLSEPTSLRTAQARCPMHLDSGQGLTVQLRGDGQWWCAVCGRGDLVTFHRRRHGVGFRAAVQQLTGLRG